QSYNVSPENVILHTLFASPSGTPTISSFVHHRTLSSNKFAVLKRLVKLKLTKISSSHIALALMCTDYQFIWNIPLNCFVKNSGLFQASQDMSRGMLFLLPTCGNSCLEKQSAKTSRPFIRQLVSLATAGTTAFM
uniref:Uracil phosphoribosyltransferase homolog n=1 Tax=Mesocestoides corti TaxID=53468 RepID=A0A5K3EYY1_MESCO